MSNEGEEDIKEALEAVLKLYDIQLEDVQDEDEDEDDQKSKSRDYSEIISKTQDRLDDLNEKAEEIFQRTGMSREQLEAYAANPSNFSKEQWEALQKVKAACEKYKRDAIHQLGDQKFEQTVEKQKKKKQPQKFAKKKHWIPL